MAFQAGTQIRPELANADYSGFVNAASIRAQSLADLGAQIGGAIKARSEKKEKARLNKQAAEMVLGLSQQYGLGIETMDDAKVAVDVFGGGANAVNALTNVAKTFREESEVPQVSSNEMLDTLKLLNLENANSIKFENGNIVIDPPGYFNTETLSPDDERYRILTQTKGGQALLQSIDSFAGFSIVE